MTRQHRGGSEQSQPKGGGGCVVCGNVGLGGNVVVGGGGEFVLEEAMFGTAPVGVHCVDVNGLVLWANRFAELHFLGDGLANDNGNITDEDRSGPASYVGSHVSSYVYSNQVASTTNGGGNDGGVGAPSSGRLTADDRTLYEEVLRRATLGNPVREIPIRFVARSTGAIVHLLLDCDGIAIMKRCGASSLLQSSSSSSLSSSSSTSSHYFRFFTRDDTSRRILEMRSNVLFQETNRSLQLLDDFMNRSMQQMRMPLTLMERACNLVAENIEDIDEVVRRNTASAYEAAMTFMGKSNNYYNRNTASGGEGDDVVGNPNNSAINIPERDRKATNENDGIGISSNPNMLLDNAAVANLLNFTSPLTVALSATSEARSVVGLATAITKDALALVDDITDLCRFDQGRVLLVEREAVKIRDLCLEVLERVVSTSSSSIPSGGGMMMASSMAGGGSTSSLVDVVFDVREGSPGRVVADRSVLQRSFSLLLNFAVNAAANAASTNSSEGGGGGGRGRVILSIQEGETSGTCKVSVFYTNPSEAAAFDGTGMNIMGGVGSGSAPMDFSATAFVSSSSTSGGNNEQQHHYQLPNIIVGNNDSVNLGNHGGMVTTSSSTGFGVTADGIAPTNEDVVELMQKYHSSVRGGASVMRRIRLREIIQCGMTSCRRDKLGLGLSLLYHLVGAQGSDLRYEIVREQQRHHGGRMVSPTMTKFWFLLPMSLDFPDRLPAEQIVVKDGSHGVNSQGGQMLSIPDPARSPILLAPLILPDNGIGKQQPRQKRAKLSQPPVPIDILNSIGVAAASAFVESPTFPSVSALAASASASHISSEQIDTSTAARDITSTKQYRGVASGARPLVLVVEDTDVSASLLCMHLRKLNCTSHRAENGEVAIEMLRSAPAPNMYSLVLMDLQMPILDGFEATRIIKGSNACNIPVVALTGETSEENRRRCDEIGFDDYKTKPLKRPQLEELLQKFVPGYR